MSAVGVFCESVRRIGAAATDRAAGQSARNGGETERVVSALAGGALVLVGLYRERLGGLALSLFGSSLI